MLRDEPGPGPGGAPGPRPAAAAGPGAGAAPYPTGSARRAPAQGTGRRRRGVPGTGPAGPATRGGHPEQREPGGGWGALGGSPAAGAAGAVGRSAPYGPRPAGAGSDRAGAPRPEPGAASVPGPREPAAPGAAVRPPAGYPGGGVRVPGPRKEYVEAFDALDAELRGEAAPAAAGQDGPVPPSEPEAVNRSGGAGGGGRAAAPGAARPGRGRAFTGVAAAAVTTVLAVVVAGQVADGGTEQNTAGRPHYGVDRDDDAAASRGDDRPAPSRTAAPRPATPVTYAAKMAQKYPLDPRLSGTGDFAAVTGHDKAPGSGRTVRYRVDVEKELPLDGKLFAEAVHKTLNDDRSWGHGGARTFERVSSGPTDFVITLASPGTTAAWCAKSDLDVTVDNVSCDSALTERVMINAYRWAQGASTYGDDELHTYRQMLINHEVGHRLGRNHEFCSRDGALAPVMMQQTKFLTTDGATCKPNAWPFPRAKR
ncbi:DUF3152 domain-containing protein [Streptomyces sp. NPDC018031]|uniref:DUF3152 domain-containing protein n=1 Tax=Streptomyces sp. NPDC018031 TaxID=3365033 RepID=UPI003789F0CF